MADRTGWREEEEQRRVLMAAVAARDEAREHPQAWWIDR